MAERPLLILPGPGEPGERSKKHGGAPRVQLPGRQRQAERLSPRFTQLQEALEQRRARLQSEAVDLVPEEVVVLETIGTVENFVRAVEKIPGMEWLAEVEERDIPPDDDFFRGAKTTEARDKPLSGRLFMVFANKSALRQMLSLWREWQAGNKLTHGLGRWGRLFERLRDVRPWGVRDRLIETGVLEDWRERVEHGQEVVPCEIELWFRGSVEDRRRARERVMTLVDGQAGRVVDEKIVEEIGYHALLVHLPVEGVGRLLDDSGEDVALVQCEQVQFFRATGQMAVSLPGEAAEEDEDSLPEERPVGSPVVALFDGLPLQAHRRLEGRLIVDDPDDFEQDYPADRRRHGTAMASLIVHGDATLSNEPLLSPLYVRPILRPDPRAWHGAAETVPENVLVVDLIHRAVRRLFEGEGDEPPVAPDVAVINLSIGIRDRPFDQAMSPLARLLDWLAWKYRVLFVVSAGNHVSPIELSIPSNDLSSLSPKELQWEVIRATARDARHRRLLSPAEGMNVLTVAATQADGSEVPPLPRWWLEPHVERGLPSPINAQGMGYRRGIKPDVLQPGGRIIFRPCFGTTERATLEIYEGPRAPGQQVASPGRAAGDRASMHHTRGTSNAAALISRAAGELHAVLEELREEPGGEILASVPSALWLKAMIGHGAEWGLAGTTLGRILRNNDNRRKFKEYVTRLLGYGIVDVERVRECTARRVTVMSGGSLHDGQGHLHHVPLPPSLSGKRGYRRLTITLAWLSPVSPRHQRWRRADLWFEPPDSPLDVDREQADWQAVRRGTLQHEILTGERASAFVDEDSLAIKVSCRADAGALEEEIPYAILTTLEVAEDVDVEIYDEVRVKVETARVRISPPA